MKHAILILLTAASLLRAESEYIVEGKIEEITVQGIVLNCELSDRIGYKRALGRTLVYGHPDQAKYQAGMFFKCFAKITGEGAGTTGPVIYKFSRRR